jgi:RNA polymerase sigma-70 factor, ECF subfamily
MTMVDPDAPAESSFSPASETDAELEARFEREAFPLLDPLYRGALALTGNRLQAEDLLRETMMNACRQFGSLPASANLRTLLYRALTNRYIKSCRARHRELIEGVGNTAGEHTSTRLTLAEIEALEALPAAVITNALQALGRDTRMVVYYADVEGFSYAEIADITSRSVSAVMSLLRRGRQQLRCRMLAACREKAACQFPEDSPEKAARRPHRAMSKHARCDRLAERDTCADRLDWFDREIVRYVLLWAPHGDAGEEDVYPTFGMTVDQLVDRFRRIIDTSLPHVDRLAKSDRELLDEASCLPTIFGQPR